MVTDSILIVAQAPSKSSRYSPVFDLVTVIRSKTPDEWARRAQDKRTEGHPVRIWREVAEAWVRAINRKERDA